ncbi:MAG TPA: adenylate/guanylate cyclase domain-containing protein [Stellaceae bacterium]
MPTAGLDRVEGERTAAVAAAPTMWRRPLAERAAALLLGPPGPARLPARVELAIRAQERDSEILVCWAQLGAITVFAAIYWLSPKTFPPNAPFEPVPATLAAYGLFTLLRLWLARRDRLGPWFLTVSVLIDVAVLMVTIWSFHLQYDQPPGLYLKAPTLLYVFIIIALRALRFDPRWLILSGLTACLGWAALVAYALAWPQMPGAETVSAVTHSYVEYMTSLKILIGAEVDKIIAFLAVTAVLSLAVVRARRMLVRAVAEGTAAMELSRFFAPEVARTIVAADDAIRPGEGMLREAAAMFIDLRGFTRLSQELDPHELVRLLSEYQGVVVPIVHRHRGSITTYLGDGIMVTFGATRPNATYAADALAAAEDLLAAFADWRSRRTSGGLAAPDVGVGICTGTVVYGAIGDAARLEYAVIGDPVNRAAKLQNHTKAERVRALTTVDALHLAEAQGHRPAGTVEPRPARTVSGIAEPLDLVVLG